MSDSSSTVDGVRPSILVKYTANRELADGTARVLLAPFDSGSPRTLERGGQAVSLTPDEMGTISGLIQFERLDEPEPTPLAPAPSPTFSSPSLSPPTPTFGQQSSPSSPPAPTTTTP